MESHIVTLENFAEVMPKWSLGAANYLYALVDMGSNGIRFSISDLSPPTARLLKCVYRERASISLFDALITSQDGKTLEFPSEIIDHVSQALSRFRDIADAYNVPPQHFVVFATEAMRKAQNAGSMLEAIKSSSGIGVCILAPEVETLLGAVGARSAFTEVDGLLLDLGGGSVQMTYMNSAVSGYELEAAKSGTSLPFGAARMITTLEGDDAQAKTVARVSLHQGMHDAFFRLQQHFPTSVLTTSGDEPKGSGIDVYLCGGGFRGYGSMLMHHDPVQPYPISSIGSYTVSGPLFKSTKDMMKTNINHEAKIFGLSKRRRQQFPAIVAVVESFIEAVPLINSVTFCSGGNREGALFMMLPDNVRRSEPLALLHQPTDAVSMRTTETVMRIILSAIPQDLCTSHVPTVLSLGLGPLLVSSIWERSGESSDANAAFELHQAVIRDPSVPALTHLARAVLGLTMCSRWGSDLSVSDKQLRRGLQELVFRVSHEAVFWADFIGCVASFLAQVLPTQPESPEQLDSVVRFHAETCREKKKPRVELTAHVSEKALRGINSQDLSDSFAKLGRKNVMGNVWKVDSTIMHMQ